jgi:glycosyltransferase involved in cell wall biosynthesis
MKNNKSRKKPRIILINGRFLLQPPTGVQRYAREVIASIAKLRPAQLRFVIAVPDRGLKDAFPGIETLCDSSALPTALWQQVRLPALMNKLGADLLWSPCNVGPVFARDHIVTIHDAAVFAGPEWFSPFFRLYYRTIFPLIGKRAEKVITVSDFSKGELIKYGVADKERIRVIPGGVNAEFAPGKSRIPDFPYVLTVGSRDPRKNFKRLIESWDRLPSDIRKGRRLVITGMEIHSFSQEGLSDIPDDVHFTGYIDHEGLPSLYAGADLFVFPSLYEGFGLPPLEAMACGCPVVTSGVASMPEVCGDAAYYIDPYSVESIADGISKVLTDKTLREDLIKKGYERAKTLNWEISAKEHIRVFEEVLTAKNIIKTGS